MMRDANAYPSDDPAVRWSALLDGLRGRTREMVIKALRNSVESGYPANAEAVRILVSYAQGQISARQYVAQILEALGFVPAAYVPAPARRAEPWHTAHDADPWRAPARTQDPWNDELSATMPASSRGLSHQEVGADHQRESGSTITWSGQNSRQRDVQAYMTGQIPMEEFLRRSGQ